MRKMLVLSFVLSVMAIGSAIANDVNNAVERGPRKVNVHINMPPCNCPPRHVSPHKAACHKCAPCHNHNHHACKPNRPAPRFGHKGAPAKPHGAPAKPNGNKPAPGKPGNPAPRR